MNNKTIMDPPEGYEIVNKGAVEPGDKILNGVVQGWAEPYFMWIGMDVSEFNGVARRKS